MSSWKEDLLSSIVSLKLRGAAESLGRTTTGLFCTDSTEGRPGVRHIFSTVYTQICRLFSVRLTAVAFLVVWFGCLLLLALLKMNSLTDLLKGSL